MSATTQCSFDLITSVLENVRARNKGRCLRRLLKAFPIHKRAVFQGRLCLNEDH